MQNEYKVEPWKSETYYLYVNRNHLKICYKLTRLPLYVTRQRGWRQQHEYIISCCPTLFLLTAEFFLTKAFETSVCHKQSHQLLLLNKQDRPRCSCSGLVVCLHSMDHFYSAFTEIAVSSLQEKEVCLDPPCDLIDIQKQNKKIKQSNDLRPWWTQQEQLLILKLLLINYISVLHWRESIMNFKQTRDRNATVLS